MFARFVLRLFSSPFSFPCPSPPSFSFLPSLHARPLDFADFCATLPIGGGWRGLRKCALKKNVGIRVKAHPIGSVLLANCRAKKNPNVDGVRQLHIYPVFPQHVSQEFSKLHHCGVSFANKKVGNLVLKTDDNKRKEQKAPSLYS